MRIVNPRVKKEDRMFLSSVRDGISRGLNQGQIGLELEITKQAVSSHLKRLKVKWQVLKDEFNQTREPPEVNHSVGKNSNFKGSESLGILRTKQTSNNHDSNSQSGAKNSQPALDKYDQITETMYQEMLLACAKANPSDLRVLAEVRAYLDKTERFTSEKGGFLKTPEEARDIEVKARAILKQIAHKDPS